MFRRAWLPRTSERIVILVHGYGEHSGRYEHTASDLARAGFEVHAYDQRGHGRSGGTRCHVRRFEHLLDDLEGFVATVRAERPSLPVAVVGHSMGGLVVAAYASQLHQPGGERDEPLTKVASREFARAVEGRARHFGQMINAELGEPFWSPLPLAIGDVMGLLPGGLR